MVVLLGWSWRLRAVGGDECVAVGDGDGVGEELQSAGGRGGEAVGRPDLVPDDLDLAGLDAGLPADRRLDVGDHSSGERAPTRGEQQFDPSLTVADGDRPEQPHVDDGNALLPAAGVEHRGERAGRPVGHRGRRLSHPVMV
jgi:hypothetical protein